MDSVGCHYASSLVNLLDAINEISDSLGGGIATNLTNIYTNFNPVVQAACVNGCNGNDWDGTPAFDPNCTSATTSCTECPSSIRNRNSCTTDATSACAAAGVVRMINNDPTFGWN